MRLLDYSFEEPERNLALDEALLNEAELGGIGETLRFWESPTPFVVLGLSQCVADEVREEACVADGIPVLRRCSAGGCVLQGPGCLNFSLILDQSNDPSLSTIRGSYREILGRVATGFARKGHEAVLEGVSDLSIGGRKFSGNAQRRKRRYILHHGTVLYEADLALIGRYLHEPTERPSYRGDRDHERFVMNVPLGGESVKELLCEEYAASEAEELSQGIIDAVVRLCESKYSVDEWTRRK